jgi:anti-sigma regulatory factor (Ser/Thr protein kinase)
VTLPATFHHEAAFYSGDDEFVELSRAFVEEGLEGGEPALVMVGARKLELLRDALGARAEAVQFADMEAVGRNPARIIPAWSRFVADHPGAGGMRGIGEPIWDGRSPSELSECQLHESLINLAFAAADDFRLICPYDTSTLPQDVIAEARRSHPVLSHEGTEDVSHDYCGIDDHVGAQFAEQLPDSPPEAEELTVTMGALRDARRLVRARALEAGLRERSDDFALAVNEVLSNSLNHAHEDGMLRVWQDADGLVCEVRDGGHIAQPLIGREEPSIGQIGGHGIWLVNLVCDLVQVRSSAHGSTVRMQMNRPLN